MNWYPAGSNGNDGNYGITKGHQHPWWEVSPTQDVRFRFRFLFQVGGQNPVGDGSGLKPGFPFCQRVQFP